MAATVAEVLERPETAWLELDPTSGALPIDEACGSSLASLPTQATLRPLPEMQNR